MTQLAQHTPAPAPTSPDSPATAAHLDPAAWTSTVTGGGETFPFVEDEDGNLTGLGHQDAAAFAAAVNRYDTACNGAQFPEDEQWDDGYVTHHWVTLDPDGERLHPVPQGTPDAFAVTGLWGQR